MQDVTAYHKVTSTDIKTTPPPGNLLKLIPTNQKKDLPPGCDDIILGKRNCVREYQKMYMRKLVCANGGTKAPLTMNILILVISYF